MVLHSVFVRMDCECDFPGLTLGNLDTCLVISDGAVECLVHPLHPAITLLRSVQPALCPGVDLAWCQRRAEDQGWYRLTHRVLRALNSSLRRAAIQQGRVF